MGDRARLGKAVVFRSSTYRQANLEQLEEFLDRGWIQSFLEVARAGHDD